MCHYGGGWKCVCERIYTYICFISKRTNGGRVEWKRIWMTGRFVGVDHFACLWPKALSPSLYLCGYGVSVVLWHSGYHAIIYAANCCCHEHLAAYPEDR